MVEPDEEDIAPDLYDWENNDYIGRTIVHTEDKLSKVCLFTSEGHQIFFNCEFNGPAWRGVTYLEKRTGRWSYLIGVPIESFRFRVLQNKPADAKRPEYLAYPGGAVTWSTCTIQTQKGKVSLRWFAEDDWHYCYGVTPWVFKTKKGLACQLAFQAIRDLGKLNPEGRILYKNALAFWKPAKWLLFCDWLQDQHQDVDFLRELWE